jgi:hypothetical protein
MVEFPPDLLAALPESGSPVALQWWLSLSDTDRRQVADLWDGRLEVKFFTPQRKEDGQMDCWEEIPAVEGGRFIATDDRSGLSEWGPGYFEYLLSNPELLLAYDPTHRTFHIGCSRHQAARECILAGSVPTSFQCPVGLPSCPLASLKGSRLGRRCSGPGQPQYNLPGINK